MVEERYIIPHILGGLGNQLFIVVACYAIQKSKECADIQILLPPEDQNKHRVSKYDYYDTLFLHFPNSHRIDIPKEMILNMWALPNYQRPADTSYGSWDPSQIQIPCFLDGYFQYYPCIKPYVRDIQEILRTPLQNVAVPFQPESGSVLIHIRRGDYVPVQEYHFLIGEEYYSKALQHFDPSLTYYIFSDDIELCKTFTVFENLTNRVFVNEVDEVVSLALMTRCIGGAIIANSTFSYWGALLGAYYYGKKVIAPHKWCRDPPVDLFPGDWVIL